MAQWWSIGLETQRTRVQIPAMHLTTFLKSEMSYLSSVIGENNQIFHFAVWPHHEERSNAGTKAAMAPPYLECRGIVGMV